MSNNKNYLSSQLCQLWTVSALYCNNIGCNCLKCEIVRGFETLNTENCKMKNCVEGLIKNKVKPTDVIQTQFEELYGQLIIR